MPELTTQLPRKAWNEDEVRAVRSVVYGECSQHNWNECKHRWMVPENIEWLLQHNQPLSNHK